MEIARKNADIARDTKKDSESMYAISIVTMLYLPASLVCGFFGTNFFALEAKHDGRLAFLVSDLCWIYGLSTVLLTTFTFSIWLGWQRRRKEEE
jgi:Mg2+ and Co2+ transporter CorA